MNAKPDPKRDDPAQSARFIEAAKEAGVSSKDFEKVFKKIVPEKRKANRRRT